MSFAADLHMHSNHSDGSDPPARVVERAVEAELDAIALTDHDTTSGVPEALEAAQESGIECLTGSEISAHFGRREIHILGLGINIASTELQTALESQALARLDRARKMVGKLNELDVPIEWEKIQLRAAGVVGRMHIAQEVHALGFAPSIQGVFDKYIKAGKPAYVPKTKFPVADAVEVSHAAKGLAFLAHPGIGDTDNILDELLKNPFDGIEVYHSRHAPGKSQHYLALAQERSLLVTGGSDCHGSAKNQPPLMGSVRLARDHYQRIQDALAKQ